MGEVVKHLYPAHIILQYWIESSSTLTEHCAAISAINIEKHIQKNGAAITGASGATFPSNVSRELLDVEEIAHMRVADLKANMPLMPYSEYEEIVRQSKEDYARKMSEVYANIRQEARQKMIAEMQRK